MSSRTISQSSESIIHLSDKDKRLAKLFSMVGPITYTLREGEDEVFAFLAHEIIEQMLSIKAGKAIYGRLVDLCGGHPTPRNLLAFSPDEIKSIGTSQSKANAILGLAKAVDEGGLDLASLPYLSDDEVMRRLTSLRGVGNWTAKMCLIFCLDRPDILPHEDVAFLQSYKWLYKTDDVAKASVQKRCRKWRPYSSIAARYLYRALDMGLTSEEFHLFK